MTRFSPEDLEDIPDERIHDQTTPSESSAESGEESGAKEDSPGPRGKAQAARPSFRSKTERRFSRLLEACPALSKWRYEPMSFRIGPKRHYRPDFLVVREGGGVECIEVKGGYTYDRALVKPSAAASLYPFFDWTVMRQKGKGKPWRLEWREPSRPQAPETVSKSLADSSHL